MKNAFQYLHEILTLIGEDRRKLPWMILLFLGSSFLDFAGLGLIAPYIALVMQPDQVTEGRIGQLLAMLDWTTDRETLLLWVSILLVTIFVAKAIAALGISFVIIRFAQSQQIRLRSRLMHAYQNMPYSAYLLRNSSEYIYSLQSLTGNFQGVLQDLLPAVSNGFIALFILCLLIWENAVALSLLILLVVSTLLVYDLLFRKRMRDYGELQNIESREIIQSINEGMDGFKEIRILGRESHFFNRLLRAVEKISFYQRRFQLIQQAPRHLLEVVLVFFVVLLVLLTMRLEIPTEALFGTLGLFGVAAIRLLPIATMFNGMLNSLRFNRDSVSRLYADVKDLTDTRKRDEYKVNYGEPFASLKLYNLQYSYPNTKTKALQDLGFEIQAGESIGLIGPSGSGKTTLVDVLLGLLEPQSGILKFNGRALHENLDEWRSQVAYLPQQVFLIDNTLKKNVALGEEELDTDEQRVHEALRQARLTELIGQLPKGLNTLVGERGVRLSGGQRQRVALARAFYYGRNVLVMDEATSALDDSTEKQIVEEIKHLKGHKTMIVIAHRLTTVRNCDRIYRLEHGRIVEQGTSEQILPKVS